MYVTCEISNIVLVIITAASFTPTSTIIITSLLLCSLSVNFYVDLIISKIDLEVTKTNYNCYKHFILQLCVAWSGM